MHPGGMAQEPSGSTAMAVLAHINKDSLTDQFKHLGRDAQKMGRQSFFKFCPPDAWQPATNLYETKDHYVVCMDLAGVNRSEISVEVRQDVLVISGRRESPRPEIRSKVHLMEIDHGNFCRSVAIPSSVSVEEIDARYADGYLWVELPKR